MLSGHQELTTCSRWQHLPFAIHLILAQTIYQQVVAKVKESSAEEWEASRGRGEWRGSLSLLALCFLGYHFNQLVCTP